MKARAASKRQTKQRIVSPLAMYTSAGKLVCKLCRVALDTELLWKPHCTSARHLQVPDLPRPNTQMQSRAHVPAVLTIGLCVRAGPGAACAAAKATAGCQEGTTIASAQGQRSNSGFVFDCNWVSW